MRPTIVRRLLILPMLAMAGCHTFQPVSYDQIQPGQEVRARVTGQWADSLDAVLQRDGRVLEGTVVDKPGSSLLLQVAVQNELRGMQFTTLSQRVVVPRDGFLELEIKELDRGRTYGAVALGGAVLGAFLIRQLSKDSGGGTIPGEGGPSETRILRPLFRIPLP